MISDEPDEDADALDDESLLETYTGIDPRGPRTGSDNTPNSGDWPPWCRTSEAESAIGAETLAWFKTNRTQWRVELDLVLRAWIAGQTQPSQRAQEGD